ncbi:MAG: dockerin type I domain-containing protein, partial [Planctomycetota bacterium]
NLSALGDYHMVSSSFEFGGFSDGMARNDVMALFLAALRYVPPPEDIFERGDANGDTMVNIADANYIFNFLFVQGPVPPCDDAADANDDSTINIADGSYILNYLFVMGSPPPPPPFGACDEDPSSDMLRCGAPCP